MYGAFQSNAFQSNAFQIIRAGSTPTPTPTPTPGINDLTGEQPSWEWLAYVEEQKRLDEARANPVRAQEKTEEIRPTEAEKPELMASAHTLRAAEVMARQLELIEKQRAEKLLLDEMIIVGLLSF